MFLTSLRLIVNIKIKTFQMCDYWVKSVSNFIMRYIIPQVMGHIFLDVNYGCEVYNCSSYGAYILKCQVLLWGIYI